jgi:hypothetical protein
VIQADRADGERSGSTSRLNGEVGYRLGARYWIVLDAYNLLNARDSDIDCFYTSRLPGEPPTALTTGIFIPPCREPCAPRCRCRSDGWGQTLLRQDSSLNSV